MKPKKISFKISSIPHWHRTSTERKESKEKKEKENGEEKEEEAEAERRREEGGRRIRHDSKVRSRLPSNSFDGN